MSIDETIYDNLSLEVNDLLAEGWVASGGKYPTGMLDLLWRVDMERVRLRDLLTAELKRPVSSGLPPVGKDGRPGTHW